MTLRLLKIYDLLAGSFWFMPGRMALGVPPTERELVALDRPIGADWL